MQKKLGAVDCYEPSLIRLKKNVNDVDVKNE